MQWFCHTSGFWTLQTLHGRFRRSKTSCLLDCGLWALCETVSGVAQTVGSGLWRAKSFFSSGPKLPFKPLKPLKRFDTCQWFCHTSGFWTLQTLHGRFRRSKTSHLLDCGLLALRETVGGVAQTVGGALWPEIALQTPQTPQTLRHLPMVLPYVWILDASDAPWTLQTLQNLALARLWALGSVRDCGRSCADCGLGALARQIFFSSGPKLPFKPLKRFDTCQWFCHTSGFWTLQTLHGRFRRSKTSHLLDCGLCETVGGVAQTVGSGLWRAKSFFSSGPKLPFKPLKPLKRFDTCQWILDASDAPWTLQTLQNLALARLWALGSVRDCGRSCADCGLGALANASTLANGSAILLDSGRFRRSMDASDGPKPRTC